MSDKEFIFESDIKNDSIDVYGDPDVSLKELAGENELEFRIKIKGRSIDNSIVNAIRRTILVHIPIYGFYRTRIFIENDKSRNMYNNDLIYNQIETLPIYDVPNFFDLENPETYLPDEIMKSIFGRFIQHRYDEPEESQFDGDGDESLNTKNTKLPNNSNKKLFKIELSINYKNVTSNDKFIDTHDAVLKIDGKIVNSYMKREPISILVLKPNETISLRAEANLGISKIDAAYEATTNAYYKEISSMEYDLSYETLGQLSKELIFEKACLILIKKLELLSKFIEKNYKEKSITSELIEIQLYGEDHTLGNLLTTALQKSNLVSEAGYAMPHPFSDQIVINYKVSKKAKIGPIQVMLDVIDYLIRVLEAILNMAPKQRNK